MTMSIVTGLLFVSACVWNIDAFTLGAVQSNQRVNKMNVVRGSTTTLQQQQQSVIENDNNDAPPLKQKAPLKIALFIEPSPFTHVSGYSNRFSELLRYLQKAGDEVEIVTTDENSPPADLPKEKFGYRVSHTLGFVFPLYKHITLSLDLPDLKGAQMIDRLKPDVIHVTSPGFIIMAALFYARVMRIPLLASYHTHLPMYGRTYLGFIPGIEEFAWWLLRMAHSRVDLTLVTSPQMKEQLVANGVPRVDVWRKGIDTVRFHPKFKNADMRSRMSEGHPDDFLLVYVGRVGNEKRLKDIRPILERMPNTRLCIVGNGPQMEEIQDYFKGTNTYFTGQMSGDELSQTFASGDAFVMPSDSETLGFVVLESMASGVPVVGAAAGGIPDLIKDGDTSFLVPVGDTDAYVERLTQLKDATFREKMGASARAEAERWGWEAATSVLRNVQYEKAMINFHSRAFGGFGRPRTRGLFRLFFGRIRRLFGRMRIPGFSKTYELESP